MSDFEARLHQLTDLSGRVSVRDVMELLRRCELRGQVQTFRETRVGVDAVDECLKEILRNIALTVLMGRGGKVHRTTFALADEATVEVRLEIVDW